MPDDPPDLQTVRSTAEFMRALRRLKAWSGLTYRQLEERAEAAGDVLPRSTLANALDRERLPRPALVEAFTRACGCDPDTVAAWGALSRRLAAATGTVQPQPESAEASRPDRTPADAGPDEFPARRDVAGGRRARLRLTLLKMAACSAGILALTCADTITERIAARATPDVGVATDDARSYGVAAPRPDRQLIQLLPSQLCLAEKPGSDLGLIYQAPCAGGFPVTPRPRSGRPGVYEFVTMHPVFGAGCMGIDKGEGLVNTFCDDDGFTRYLVLEPVTADGFRLRVPGRSGCVGVHETDHAHSWARLALRPCSASMKGQIIRFAPAAAG
ncbi:helix-turn-helix domain-containing protein [Streptosporangium sp. NPDC001559]|uniref:helix-turn-helix domain-containing protein n=1 Tax=Streptosporangium sp. NPDC001559 TaxID=3366187 RepID=UPI0036E4B992